MYRPDGYDLEVIARENLPMFKWDTEEYAQVVRGIDIGADAMLKALKKDSLPHDASFEYGILWGLSHNGKKGFMAFIPDVEEADMYRGDGG